MVDLKRISFFKNFSHKQIGAIEAHSSLLTCGVGDVVFYEQDEPKYLFLLLDGRVDIYKTNSKSKQLHIHTIKSVDFLGEVAIFYNMPYPITAECATKCKIIKIDYKKLGIDLLEDLFFCRELIQLLHKRVMVLMQVIDSSFMTTKERVAKFILNNIDDFNGTTYTDISKRINMTPETLSRIINEFKRKNYITINDNHNITIIDKDKLLEVSGQCI